MAVSIGSSNLLARYVGNRTVERVMRGTEEMWSAELKFPLTGSTSITQPGASTQVFSFVVPETGLYEVSFTAKSTSEFTLRLASEFSTDVTNGPNPAGVSRTLSASPEFKAGDTARLIVETSTDSTVQANWAIYSLGPVPPHPLISVNPSGWLPYSPSMNTNRGSFNGAVSLYSPTPTWYIDSDGLYSEFLGGTQQMWVDADFATGGTIGGWFKLSEGNPNGGVAPLHRAREQTTNTRELYWNMDPASDRVYAGAKINNVWWDVSITKDIRDGNWHHVSATLVRNSTTTSWTLSIVVDGLYMSSTKSGLSPIAGFGIDDPLLIGGQRDGKRLRCSMDDVFVSNRAVPVSLLAAIYNAGRGDPSLFS